jgi:carbamoyltransferase
MEQVSHIAIPCLAEPEQAESADPFFADVLLECRPVAAMESYPPVWRSRLDALGKPLIFVDHHLAHAASAFFLSGLTEALVVTSDYGAPHCAWNMGFYRAGPDGISPLQLASHAHYHPLCSLYSQVTALLGFRPNVHEGKITGLAAYGKPHPECEEKLWMLHREICESPTPLYDWVGGLDESITASLEVNPAVASMFRERLRDYSDAEVACAVQRLTERRVTTLLRRALELYPSPAVLLAGGLFANVKVNLEVKRLGVNRIFVCPPMGDEGIALGAAVVARAQLGPGELRGSPVRNLFWGSPPAASTSETLDQLKLSYTRPSNINEEIAGLLAAGKTVALVRGRMEFGPRALGHRSILHQATDPAVNDWLNKKLHRTEFMPFAPIVRAEAAPDLFDKQDLSGAEHTAQFMTICFSCRDRFRKLCPAVVHVDGTARPQLVRAELQPDLHAILTAYERLTGLPALINTSFNVHDEPIVASARDAVVAFFQSELDYLVLDDCLLTREDNPSWSAATAALSGPALREEKLLRRAAAAAYGGRNLQQQQWIAKLETGKTWLEQQNAELKAWTKELDRARAWLDEQRTTWQTAAREREKLVEEQRESSQRLEQQNNELRNWVEELEHARHWLETQRGAWEHTARERKKIADERREWLQGLEQAKVWLGQQATNWRQTAEKREKIIEEQRAWLQKLEQAKNWLEQERLRWQQLAEERGRIAEQPAPELASLKREFLADRAKTAQQHHATVQALEQTGKHLQQQLDASRAAIRELEGTLTSSRETVARRDKAIQENRATIQSLERIRQELQQQLDAARAAIEELQQKQRDQAAIIEEWKSSFAELQQQRTNLLASVQRRETHIRDVETKFLYRILSRLRLFSPPFKDDDQTK